MRNYLVITLGTRDVQIRRDQLPLHGFSEIQEHDRQHTRHYIEKNGVRIAVMENFNFPEFYTIPPREGGRIIYENYELFKPVIDFPIIRDFVREIHQKHGVYYLLMVYTDQQKDMDAGKIKRIKNYLDDTLYFKDIIQRYFQEDPAFDMVIFDEYGIETEVANIDYQYRHFREVKSDLFLVEVSHIARIFLLPQGGIDQINHAITLQLLQAYRSKVVLYQKAENDDLRQLRFPQFFLGDLNRQKILKHLSDYDFGMIGRDLIDNDRIEIYHLAQYAHKRLNLQYDDLDKHILKIRRFDLVGLPLSRWEKLTDIYLAAKINYKQQKYTEFLWRIYTLNENLLRLEVEKVLGVEKEGYMVQPDGSKLNFETALARVAPDLPAFVKSHRTPGGKNIDIDKPGRFAYRCLLPELVRRHLLEMEEEKLLLYDKMANRLERLSFLRNEVAHNLGAATLQQINNTLAKSEPGYNSSKLMDDLHALFGLSSPFGIYDAIKGEIEGKL